MAGWIKIYYNFLQWEWFEKPEMVQLFLYFLLNANYEEKKWQGITVKRGQLVTSRPALKSKLRMTDQQIRTCISRLESTGEITKETTNKYTLITICNYEAYQSAESLQQPTSNRRATDNHAENQPTSQPTNQPTKNTSQLFKKEQDNYVLNECNQPTNQLTNQPTDNRQGSEKSTLPKEGRIKNNIKDIRLESGANFPLPPVSTEPEASNPKTEKIPFKEIKEMWNTTCTIFPKLHVISENRKNKMRIRIEEMGGVEKAIQLLKIIFEKAQASNFLKGDNKRGWKASFDWLFENDKNWVKVYEGNYDNDKEASEKAGSKPSGSNARNYDESF